MSLPPSVLLDLSRRYCEPHRRYHSIEHIAQMLWRARELPLSDEQLLAIWYHDAVYEVPPADNERQSAALARQQLSAAGWPAEGIDLIERIVLDTIEHEPTIPEAALVVDLDLAGLASDWPIFEQNTADIRAEYAYLDDVAFVAGQRAVFERLLRRPHIFHSSWGAPLEQAARANLERALSAW